MAGYLCVAENKVGTVEKLFSLTVQGKNTSKGVTNVYPISPVIAKVNTCLLDVFIMVVVGFSLIMTGMLSSLRTTRFFLFQCLQE